MSTIPKKIYNIYNGSNGTPWFETWDELTYEEKRDFIRWDKMTFGQRLHMIKIECAAINELSDMKNLGITSTPHILNHRFIFKRKINKNDIKLAIYFYGDERLNIDTITAIGHCPVCYGTGKNKEKVNDWKLQLNKLECYFA